MKRSVLALLVLGLSLLSQVSAVACGLGGGEDSHLEDGVVKTEKATS